MMPRLIAMAVWIFISAYSFYVVSHVGQGRERTGRRLVGIGAMLVAAVLAIPEIENEFSPADLLSIVAVLMAGVFLAIGLIMAFPKPWRTGADASGTDASETDQEG